MLLFIFSKIHSLTHFYVKKKKTLFVIRQKLLKIQVFVSLISYSITIYPAFIAFNKSQLIIEYVRKSMLLALFQLKILFISSYTFQRTNILVYFFQPLVDLILLHYSNI